MNKSSFSSFSIFFSWCKSVELSRDLIQSGNDPGGYEINWETPAQTQPPNLLTWTWTPTLRLGLDLSNFTPDLCNLKHECCLCISWKWSSHDLFDSTSYMILATQSLRGSETDVTWKPANPPSLVHYMIKSWLRYNLNPNSAFNKTQRFTSATQTGSEMFVASTTTQVHRAEPSGLRSPSLTFHFSSVLHEVLRHQQHPP